MGAEQKATEQTAKQAETKPEAPKAAAPKVKDPALYAANGRSLVKARNPSKGVYRTLDGEFEIRMADRKKGLWNLFRGNAAGRMTGLVEARIKGYDAALSRIVELGLATVEGLNTQPAEAAKPADPPKVEAKDEPERRSGATGPAPAKPKAGRPHTTRRATKVG